jgi:hypothetical protein
MMGMEMWSCFMELEGGGGGRIGRRRQRLAGDTYERL